MTKDLSNILSQFWNVLESESGISELAWNSRLDSDSLREKSRLTTNEDDVVISIYILLFYQVDPKVS